MPTSDLSLEQARALIVRGIDKAEELRARGAIVVIGASGALISGSRMDHGGAGGFARARSKAWIAATQQLPSVVHLQRMQMIAPQMASGFTVLSPEAMFPGRRRDADPRATASSSPASPPRGRASGRSSTTRAPSPSG